MIPFFSKVQGIMFELIITTRSKFIAKKKCDRYNGSKYLIKQNPDENFSKYQNWIYVIEETLKGYKTGECYAIDE